MENKTTYTVYTFDNGDIAAVEPHLYDDPYRRGEVNTLFKNDNKSPGVGEYAYGTREVIIDYTKEIMARFTFDKSHRDAARYREAERVHAWFTRPDALA